MKTGKVRWGRGEGRWRHSPEMELKRHARLRAWHEAAQDRTMEPVLRQDVDLYNSNRISQQHKYFSISSLHLDCTILGSQDLRAFWYGTVVVERW